LPTATTLLPCSPNPFNPVTTIQFELASATDVSLRIYDVKGRLVRTLLDENMPRERHRLTWDGTNNHGSQVASGIYFLRMVAGSTVEVQKMALLK
jgi:flagellar hook assembly protein FlgD